MPDPEELRADAVGLLLRDSDTEFEASTPSAEELAARSVRLLALDDVIVVLAGGEDPTGSAYLTLRPTPCSGRPLSQLEELHVRPHLRDRGTGTAPLQRALELCRQRNAAETHTDVDEGDADTRRSYERHGFLDVLPVLTVGHLREPGGRRHRPSCGP